MRSEGSLTWCWDSSRFTHPFFPLCEVLYRCSAGHNERKCMVCLEVKHSFHFESPGVFVSQTYNIYEACIWCRQDIKCNKYYYISSGLIMPGVMAISVTLDEWDFQGWLVCWGQEEIVKNIAPCIMGPHTNPPQHRLHGGLKRTWKKQFCVWFTIGV